MGFGDLDGDGTDDLITRNTTTGRVWVSFLKDGQISQRSELYQIENLDWLLAHIGDYNGDGKADLFWRNAVSGENKVHLMDGSTILERGVLRNIDERWLVAH